MSLNINIKNSFASVIKVWKEMGTYGTNVDGNVVLLADGRIAGPESTRDHWPPTCKIWQSRFDTT